jgi:arylformamidase
MFRVVSYFFVFLSMSGHYVDLSHTIFNELETYQGLPAIHICDYWSREQSAERYIDGATFQIAKIEMVANTGTYIDFPFHRFEHGEDAADAPLGKLAEIPGIKIHVPYTQQRAITENFFKGIEVREKAVLVQTDWDAHWNTAAYHKGGPYLTEGAAHYLAEAGAVMVGIDAHNIDNTTVNARPVHTLLLSKGIYIVEHLTNLSNIPNEGFHFYAVPPKIKGVGSFPVRAMAKLTEVRKEL